MLQIPSCMAALTVCVLLSGCQARDPVAPSSAELPRSPVPISASSTDQWLGQWTGPEGTFLLLSKVGDVLSVTIQSLDGPNTYQGRAVGDRIEFARNGKTESIHASSGLETGMKWLTDKTNCLTIQLGEGFCRD